MSLGEDICYVHRKFSCKLKKNLRGPLNFGMIDTVKNEKCFHLAWLDVDICSYLITHQLILRRTKSI